MNNLSSLVADQLRESARIKMAMAEATDLVVEVAEIWIEALQRGNKIMFCGNGGSAADSQHLAAEFVGHFNVEREGLPSLALTVDTSVLTSVSNDYQFENVFARQVQALGVPGDVLVGLTTSGGSANVLKAFEAAKRGGITTVAFTGAGGVARGEIDYVVAVPSEETPRIQEAHIAVGHVICALVDEVMIPKMEQTSGS